MIAYLKLTFLYTHFPFVYYKKTIFVQSKLTQKHRHFLRFQKIFLQNAVCSIPCCCFTHPTLISLVTQCGLICVYPIDHTYINCWFQVYRWSVLENSTPPPPIPGNRGGVLATCIYITALPVEWQPAINVDMVNLLQKHFKSSTDNAADDL